MRRIPSRPPRVTAAYRARLRSIVCQRPRSLDLPFPLWTAQRLADYLAGHTGIRVFDETIRRELALADIVLSRPQHTISSPDPEYAVKKKAIEDTRDTLTPDDVFYYADEFNLSWRPTIRALLR